MCRHFMMKNVLLSMMLSSVGMKSHATDVERMNANDIVGRVIGDRHLDMDDRETAMDAALNEQILKCFTVIYNRLPTVSNRLVDRAFDQVVSFIKTPQNRVKQRPKPVRMAYSTLQRKYVAVEELPLHANSLMYLNALDAMSGEHYNAISRNNSYGYCQTHSGSVEVRMKELLARVWLLIEAHGNQSEKQMMKESLFVNLNYCVEDRGSLTCEAGKTKRLIMSIEGHIEDVNLTLILPEPSEFCSNYLTEFFRNLDERHPDDPLNFVSSFDVPESFSLQDLENRIVLERGVVHLRINGVYGEGSQKARAAIALMEEKFEGWRCIYNDNKPVGVSRSVVRTEPVPEVRRPAPMAIPTTRFTAAPAIVPAPAYAANNRVMELLRLLETYGDSFFETSLAAELERLMEQPVPVTQQPIVTQQLVVTPQHPGFVQQPVVAPQRPALSPKAAARVQKAAQKAAAGARKAAARAQKVAQKAAARARKVAEKAQKAAQKSVVRARKVAQKVAARDRRVAQKAAARRLRGR